MAGKIPGKSPIVNDGPPQIQSPPLALPSPSSPFNPTLAEFGRSPAALYMPCRI